MTVGITALDRTHERQAWVLAVLIFVPVLGGPLLGQRGTDLLGAPALFAISFALGYLAPLRAFAAQRDAASAFLGYEYRDHQLAMHAALTTAILAAGAFWIGWWLTRSPPAPATRAKAAWRPRRIQLVVTTYFAIGLTAFALGVQMLGGIAALLAAQADRLRAFSGINFLLYGAQLLPIAWLVTLRARFDRPGVALSPRFLLLGVLALGPTLLLGTKVILFFTTGTAVLMFNQLRRRLGILAVAFTGVTSMFAALGYDLYFREYLVNQEITSVVLDQLSLSERMDLILDRTIGSQFMQIQELALVIESHDRELPAEHGRTFLPVFTQLIPRKLWAGKPTTPAGLFAERLRPDLVEAGTTFPPSFVAELYWNGGAALVALGMLLLGALCHRVEAWRSTATPMASVVGSITLLMLPMLLRGDFSDTVTAWITLAAPCALAIGLSTRAGDVRHSVPVESVFPVSVGPD